MKMRSQVRNNVSVRKKSLHIQQVILTVYLTVSWDNMEKSQRQSKRKLPVHTVFQLPAGTTLVLFCI